MRSTVSTPCGVSTRTSRTSPSVLIGVKRVPGGASWPSTTRVRGDGAPRRYRRAAARLQELILGSSSGASCDLGRPSHNRSRVQGRFTHRATIRRSGVVGSAIENRKRCDRIGQPRHRSSPRPCCCSRARLCSISGISWRVAVTWAVAPLLPMPTSSVLPSCNALPRAARCSGGVISKSSCRPNMVSPRSTDASSCMPINLP